MIPPDTTNQHKPNNVPLTYAELVYQTNAQLKKAKLYI